LHFWSDCGGSGYFLKSLLKFQFAEFYRKQLLRREELLLARIVAGMSFNSLVSYMTLQVKLRPYVTSDSVMMWIKLAVADGLNVLLPIRGVETRLK
jgi:hypothetical protein